MLQFLQRKKSVSIEQANPWGVEKKDSVLECNFSLSVQVAMQFVYAAIHGRLPREIQEEIRFKESPLPEEKFLCAVHDYRGIKDYGTGMYRDRTLWLAFTPTAFFDRTCIEVYLRQYAGTKGWKVMSMTYPRNCTDGGRSYEKYEVVVTPYVRDVGTESEHFAVSGFRPEYWD